MRITTPAAVVLLLTALAPAPALAYGPNLLANPGFASGFGSWSNTGALTWKQADRDANPLSGSVYSSLADAGGGTYGPWQCVVVAAGTKYAAGASFWIPSSNDPAVQPRILVEYHDAPGCGHPFSTPIVYGGYTRDAWQGWYGVSTAPPGAVSVRILIGIYGPPGASISGYTDTAFFGTGACAPSATKLCLNRGRFEVTVSWDTSAPSSGQGQAVPFAADSGSFWFFSPDNLELNVKVLDGCALNNRYWVFAAGLTDVHTVITVHDTQTGAVNTYQNPLGQLFATRADTNAFPTCP